MNAENFAYWINGAIELGRQKTFDEEQVGIIKDHLGLVIKKVTPQYHVTSSPGLTFSMPTIGDSSISALTC